MEQFGFSSEESSIQYHFNGQPESELFNIDNGGSVQFCYDESGNFISTIHYRPDNTMKLVRISRPKPRSVHFAEDGCTILFDLPED